MDWFFDNISLLHAIGFIVSFSICVWHNKVRDLQDVLVCVSSGSASIILISGIALTVCGLEASYIDKLKDILPHLTISGVVLILISALLLKSAFTYKKREAEAVSSS